MNFPQNSLDVDLKLNLKIASFKDNISQDILKSIPSNQMTINLTKESNSSQVKKNLINIKQKNNLCTIEKEEKENDPEEEEEINSDEYVSSTMLDVDTNTYINMTNNTKNIEENNYSKISKKNSNNFSKGKLKASKKDNKDQDVDLLKKIQTIKEKI